MQLSAIEERETLQKINIENLDSRGQAIFQDLHIWHKENTIAY